MGRIEYFKLVTHNSAHCLWVEDVKEKNLDYLNRIDPRYFEFLASACVQMLEEDKQHYAAMALRTTYGHALETLFALLCATVQAPKCVFGWLLRYMGKDLYGLVKDITYKEPFLSPWIPKLTSWDDISKLVNIFTTGDAEKDLSLRSRFAKLWERLAHEFVDEFLSEEYNSIKHGLRGRPGGHFYAMGAEETFGIAPPLENMTVYASSQFGSSFYVSEKLHNRFNFRVMEYRVNWNPENLYHAIKLISLSILNVVAFLKYDNGAPREQIKVFAPTDETYFEAPWKVNTGMNMGTGSVIEEKDVVPFTAKEILSAYSDEKDMV